MFLGRVFVAAALAWCCCFVGGAPGTIPPDLLNQSASAIAAYLVEDFEDRFGDLSATAAAGLQKMMVDNFDLKCSPQIFLRLGYEITFGTGLYAEAIADHLALNTGDQISFKPTDLLASFTYGLSTNAFTTVLPTGVSGDGMLVDASLWTTLAASTQEGQLPLGCHYQEFTADNAQKPDSSAQPLLLVSYRRDVLAALGTPTVPSVWEGLLTWAQDYSSLVAAAQDADPSLSLPQYPICIDSSQGCKASFILAAMAAAYIDGTGNTYMGVYFDPATMVALGSNEAIDRVLSLYSAFVALSAPPPTSCRMWTPSFFAGDCAMTIDFSTAQKSNEFSNMKGLVGTSLLPGSLSLLDRQTNKLVKEANHISFAAQPGWKVIFPADVCGTYVEYRLRALSEIAMQSWDTWIGLLVATKPSDAEEYNADEAAPPASLTPPPQGTVRRRSLQDSFYLDNFTKAGYDADDIKEYLDVYWGALRNESYIHNDGDFSNTSHLVTDISIQGAAYYRQCYDIAAQSSTTLQNRSMIMDALETCVTRVLDSSGNRLDLMMQYWDSLRWKPAVAAAEEEIPSEPADPNPYKTNKRDIIIATLIVPLVAVGTVLLIGAFYMYRWKWHGGKYLSMFVGVPPPKCAADTTLVVTDIAGSTLLWETLDAELMDQALNVHHHTIRRLLLTFMGYESATEGDSFILAFHVPEDAVNFAAAAQLGLNDAPWPEEMLKHPNCTVEWCAIRAPESSGSGMSEAVKDVVNQILTPRTPFMAHVNPLDMLYNSLNRQMPFMAKVTGKTASFNSSPKENDNDKHTASLPLDIKVVEMSSEESQQEGGAGIVRYMRSNTVPALAVEWTTSAKSSVLLTPLKNSNLPWSSHAQLSSSTLNGINITPNGSNIPLSCFNCDVMISPSATSLFVFKGPKASTSLFRNILEQQFRWPDRSSPLGPPMCPSELARESHVIAFRGMRVRMGIHSMGMDMATYKDQATYNQATGRVQYSGTFLMMAKAVEDAAQSGGQVVISESTVQRLTMADSAKSLMILNMGKHLLSNDLGVVCSLYQMQPYVLACRLTSFDPLRTDALVSPTIMDAPVGVVTIVFCNVQGAQSLLRSDIADDARRSMQMFHEAVNRETIFTGGYIVELVDGLALAAFPTPGQAILWSLRLRHACLELDYPSALLEDGLCEEVKVMVPCIEQPSRLRSVLLLRGLRLKFGIDAGKLQDSINVATGRMAYRGRSMNRAARIGVGANPGQVLCSSHVWNAALVHAPELQSEIITTSLGQQAYKGVVSKVEVLDCNLRSASIATSDMLATRLKQRGQLCGRMLANSMPDRD